MSMIRSQRTFASAAEIRETLGAIDESLVTALQDLGATIEEIREAAAWLSSDDYLHRKLHHTAHGRVAQVIDLLKDELRFPER